jgi:hypothetical protein
MDLEPLKFRPPEIRISGGPRAAEDEQTPSPVLIPNAADSTLARRAREELLVRLHAQRHALLDRQSMGSLTDGERSDLADLEIEIDRWELIEERENQEPRIRDIAALADRILGAR